MDINSIKLEIPKKKITTKLQLNKLIVRKNLKNKAGNTINTKLKKPVIRLCFNDLDLSKFMNSAF